MSTDAVSARRVIRPCMVSYYFHPSYSGSAIQAFNLSKHLRELGLSPMIVSANLTDSPAYEEYDGIPVHRIPVASSRELKIPSFWVSLSRFMLARRHEFDVVHAHGTLQHGSASLAGRLLGKPSILKVAMANSDIAFERQGRVRGALNRFMVGKFSRYIATTREIQSELAERGLDTGRVRLVTNGVDTDTYCALGEAEKRALRERLSLPAGPLVSYVGIINRRKNVDGVLRIWHNAVKAGAPGHLLLIGPMPDSEAAFLAELKAYIDQNGLATRVTFVGAQQSAAPFLQASDIFLFPSRQEGMPNSVLEAMACNLPVLVSGAAGTTSVVTDNVTGFTIELSDEAGFSSKLLRLTQDEPLRQRMGRGGRQFIEAHYSLRTIATQYVSIYKELLNIA